MPGMIWALHRRKLSRVSFSEMAGPKGEGWELAALEDDAIARYFVEELLWLSCKIDSNRDCLSWLVTSSCCIYIRVTNLAYKAFGCGDKDYNLDLTNSIYQNLSQPNAYLNHVHRQVYRRGTCVLHVTIYFLTPWSNCSILDLPTSCKKGHL